MSFNKKGTLILNGRDYSNGGGGSASIDYGDKSEFDIWSETAKNGELFVRTDDNTEGGGERNIYDSEERIIGTWFGKPLYRKIYRFDSIYNDLSIDDNLIVDNLVSFYGNIVDGGASYNLPLNENIYVCRVRKINSDGKLKFQILNYTSLTNCNLVIEYTKVGD